MPPRAQGSTRSGWRPVKRARAPGEDAPVDLVDALDACTVIDTDENVFNLRDPARKIELIRLLWGSQDSSLRPLTDANPALAVLLNRLVDARAIPDPEEPWLASSDRKKVLIESLLCSLLRGGSYFETTVLTARVSVAAYRFHINRDFWQFLHTLGPGILMSHQWTEEVVLSAGKYRPGASYPCVKGVGAVMFDNYSRKILYKSQWTAADSGYRLDMTNWASMAVPQLVPFDASAECVCHHPTQCPHPTSTPSTALLV